MMPLDEILLIGEIEPFEGAPSEETDPSCSGMVDPARKILFSGLPCFGGSESESEVAQSYPTPCDPMDCSLPGSSIHAIFQARVLEWVAISFSRIDAFELWCWRRILRVPWTASRSNQSILKEISPGCSLEGLMLKLKLQYGHLM